MSLKSLCGVPGCGKTFMLTREGIKHYKKYNSFLRRTIRKIKKQPVWINNVYSSYPILLDKKRKIYSRIVCIDDLKNQYSFEPHALILLDEPQLDYDSIADSFIFPRAIGMFMQAHRHFGINDVVFATQHPNRLVVYEKNIMNEYYRIMSKVKIPFLPWGIICTRKCYEIDDYAVITTNSKEKRAEHSISRKIFFFNFNKVGKSYDSTYLKPLNLTKPKLDKGTYHSLVMPKVAYKRLEDKFIKYQVSTKKMGKEKLS